MAIIRLIAKPILRVSTRVAKFITINLIKRKKGLSLIEFLILLHKEFRESFIYKVILLIQLIVVSVGALITLITFLNEGVNLNNLGESTDKVRDRMYGIYAAIFMPRLSSDISEVNEVKESSFWSRSNNEDINTDNNETNYTPWYKNYKYYVAGGIIIIAVLYFLNTQDPSFPDSDTIFSFNQVRNGFNKVYGITSDYFRSIFRSDQTINESRTSNASPEYSDNSLLHTENQEQYQGLITKTSSLKNNNDLDSLTNLANNTLPQETINFINNLDISKIDPRLFRREKYYDVINYLQSIASGKSLPTFGTDEYKNLLVDLYDNTQSRKVIDIHTFQNLYDNLKFLLSKENEINFNPVHLDYFKTLFKELDEVWNNSTIYNFDIDDLMTKSSERIRDHYNQTDKYFKTPFEIDKTPVPSVLSTPKNNITPKASSSRLTLDDIKLDAQNNTEIKQILTVDDIKIPSPPLPPLLSSILASEKLNKLDNENNKNPLMEALKGKITLKKTSIIKDASAPTHSGRIMRDDEVQLIKDNNPDVLHPSSFKNTKDKLFDKPSFEDNLKLKGKELFSDKPKLTPQHTTHDDELARRLSIRRKHMIDDNTSPTVQPSNMVWDDDETPSHISTKNIPEIKISKYEEEKRQFELDKNKFLEDKERLKLDREEMNNKLKTLYPDNTKSFSKDDSSNVITHSLTSDNLDLLNNDKSEDTTSLFGRLPEINLRSQEINPLRLKKVKGINPFSRKSYEQNEPTFEQNINYLNKSLNDKTILSHELNNKLIDGDIFYNPTFKKYVKFEGGKFKEHVFIRLDNSDNQSTVSLETQTDINVPVQNSRNDDNFLHFILKKVRTRKGGDEVTPSDIRFVSETSDFDD